MLLLLWVVVLVAMTMNLHVNGVNEPNAVPSSLQKRATKDKHSVIRTRWGRYCEREGVSYDLVDMYRAEMGVLVCSVVKRDFEVWCFCRSG